MSSVFEPKPASERRTADARRTNALASWWQQLATRERGLVILGVVVLLLVAGYLSLWEPAALGIRKLEADLPPLRAEAVSLRTMADEAERLRAAGGNTTPIAPDDRVAAVRRSLARAGLARTNTNNAANNAANSAADAAAASNKGAPTLTVNGAVASVGVAPSARVEPPEVTAEANGRVRVRFSDIDYGVWVAWLAATEGELAARAVRVSVAALAPNGPVGHVRTDALFDWTAPAQAAPPSASSTASSPASSAAAESSSRRRP